MAGTGVPTLVPLVDGAEAAGVAVWVGAGVAGAGEALSDPELAPSGLAVVAGVALLGLVESFFFASTYPESR